MRANNKDKWQGQKQDNAKREEQTNEREEHRWSGQDETQRQTQMTEGKGKQDRRNEMDECA
jgi:hypothetical protein